MESMGWDMGTCWYGYSDTLRFHLVLELGDNEIVNLNEHSYGV